MKVLVTGSAGHLGEALVRTLISEHQVVGLDILDSKFTTAVGTMLDRKTLERR
jgi:UDP-glucose 4-epimerase